MDGRAYGPRVAVAADGGVAVAYEHAIDGLRFAVPDGAEWSDEIVAPASRSPSVQQVTLDASGCAHVVFLAHDAPGVANPVLVDAVRDGAGWSSETRAGIDGNFAVTADAEGNPVAFVAPTGGSSRVLRSDRGSWRVETTGLPSADGYRTPAIAVGPDGVRHVLYHRTPGIRYASNASGVWVEDPSFQESFAWGGMAADPEGRPHVFALGSGGGTLTFLRHLWKDADGWHSREAFHDPESEEHREVRGAAFDGRGHPFVCLPEALARRRWNRWTTWIAWFDGEDWRRRRVPSPPRAPPLGIAVTRDGVVHYAVATSSRVTRLTAALAGLVVLWNGLTTTPAAVGWRAEGEILVRNVGAARSRPTRLSLLVSDDDHANFRDDSAGRAGHVPGLAPGAERRYRVALDLPAEAAGRYLLAVADESGRLDDLDRPDNTAAARVGE